MTIKDRLLQSGAIINTKETHFGKYRREIEVWFRKDSAALRELVKTLIEQLPDMQLWCASYPIITHSENNGSFLWTIHDPHVTITIDFEDCAHIGDARRASLKGLLSRVATQGPKNPMAFRITVNPEVWRNIVEATDQEMALSLS